METAENTLNQQQTELHHALWRTASELRGNMDANEFKDYILGLIFYRYLSEKTELIAADILKEEDCSYISGWNDPALRPKLSKAMLTALGCIVEPQYLYSSMIRRIERDVFNTDVLQRALKSITDSADAAVSGNSLSDASGKTSGSQSALFPAEKLRINDFSHIFSGVDLTSIKLGLDENSRSALISRVLLSIDRIKLGHTSSEMDILGDTYKYLIGQFAASAGKKAGEFYTPPQVSGLLARLVTVRAKELSSVYDPCCGSGSLLLQIAKEARVQRFYGQELNATTCNLAKMNMVLRHISCHDFCIANDDVLEHPYFSQMKFSAVVANPPYSANWSCDEKFLEDPRFCDCGFLPPKSKADYAFVLHMLYHLDEDGTMAVILPHGVLFRSGVESKIRKYLVHEKNCLDAVIGLPPNIFYGTAIPTAVLIFQKRRKNPENILFIDASAGFEKCKKKNVLRDSDIDKIVECYSLRSNEKGYCRTLSMEELAENDYNLNISLYVDAFDDDESIDIHAVMECMKQIDSQMEQLDQELNVYLRQLGLPEF